MKEDFGERGAGVTFFIIELENYFETLNIFTFDFDSQFFLYDKYSLLLQRVLF